MPVKGSFRNIQGHGVISPQGAVSGQVTVESNSIDTHSKMRDKRLRGGDFFAADTYRHITFSLSRVEPRDSAFELSGLLTVKSQTRPIVFTAFPSMLSENEVAVDAELVIDRSDYGMSLNPMGMTSLSNTIDVHIRLIRT